MKPQYRKVKRHIVSFGPVEIKPQSNITVTSKPGVLFKGDRLINSSDVDGLFIEELLVGTKNQLPTEGGNPISVRAFPGDAPYGEELLMDACDAEALISVRVQNTSNEARNFSMSIFGDQVEFVAPAPPPPTLSREEQRHARWNARLDKISSGISTGSAAVGVSVAAVSIYFQSLFARLTAAAVRVTNFGAMALVQATSPLKGVPVKRDTRGWHVGFGPVKVPPNATVTVQAQPQCLFKGRRIVNTGDADLILEGLFVGQRSQLPTFTNGILLKTYNPEVQGNDLAFTPCDPALFITWQVRNPSEKEKTFAVTVLGDVEVL